jgi:hypothetical protein
MSPDDYEEYIQECVKCVGGWEKLEADVATGVANGHSEGKQLAILAEVLKQLAAQ